MSNNLFEYECQSVRELRQSIRAVERHSLNGHMPGSGDVLRWLNQQADHFDKRIASVVWA